MSGSAINEYASATQRWLEQMVIGLNLCPFAKKPWQRQQIKFVVNEESRGEICLAAFADELACLQSDADLETTLLILPEFDSRFFDFLDLIDEADDMIDQLDLRGIFQLAHFHPEYQFAGEPPESASHFTNRAPHSTLHLIREASISRVLASYPTPEDIPVNNIATMERLGIAQLQALLNSFRSAPEE